MKINALIPEYLKNMRVIGRSYYTIRVARYTLRSFLRYLENEQIDEIGALSRDVIEDYQQELAFTLTAKGMPLSVRTQVKRLGTIKGFSRFLKEKDYLVHDPAESIQLPKEPRRLPRSILSPTEIKRLMKAQDVRTHSGYRDRVLLEILYDTAIRRSELSNIKLIDLDLDAGYLKVLGKGDKERVVPLCKRVCGLVRNYILFVRPSLLQGKDHGWLMLNSKGGQLKAHTIWKIVKQCGRTAKLKKNITTHTFRHYAEYRIMPSNPCNPLLYFPFHVL